MLFGENRTASREAFPKTTPFAPNPTWTALRAYPSFVIKTTKALIYETSYRRNKVLPPFSVLENIDLQLNFYSLKMEAPSPSETVIPIIGFSEDTVARTVNLGKTVTY
jgi:hypothetical protein